MVVKSYKSGLTGTYAETASFFEIGEATVSRLLRRDREASDLSNKPRGGHRPRLVDLGWLKESAKASPDDRLIDRIASWKAKSGIEVSAGTMSRSMAIIGWSYKKKHQ